MPTPELGETMSRKEVASVNTMVDSMDAPSNDPVRIRR